MKMITGFKSRLIAAMKAGDLTRGDLHHWFGRPRPTIRYWLDRALPTYDPDGPPGRLARKNLRMLEFGIEKGVGFPVPETLSAHERPRYIVQVYHAVNAKFSNTRAPGEGLEKFDDLLQRKGQ
jgi:hypothetical protein